jgi:hypothetical protein
MPHHQKTPEEKSQAAEKKIAREEGKREKTDWARTHLPGPDERKWFGDMTAAQQKGIAKNWDSWSPKQRDIFRDIMNKEAASRDLNGKWKTDDEEHLVQSVEFFSMKMKAADKKDILFEGNRNYADKLAQTKAKATNVVIYTVDDPAQLSTVKGAFMGRHGNLVIKKYLAGYNPFQYRQNFFKEETKQILGTNTEFHEFKEKMYEPLVRQFEDGTILKARATCDQPLQLRVMGNLETVRDLTIELNKFLQQPHIQQIMHKDTPSMVGGAINIGFDKLEADKHNRNKTYCSNTLRSYLNVEDHLPARPVIRAWQ